MLDTLLEITQKLAKVGGWGITYGENKDAEKTVHWTPAIYEIFEHEQDKPLSLEESARFVLPEYLEAVSTSIMRCRDLGEPCDVEFGIRTEKGNEKWVHLLMRATFDDAGRIVSIVGALQDLTLQRQQEQANRLLSQRLLTTIENMSEAFYMLDREWRVIYVNQEADRLMDRNRVVGSGQVLWELFPYLIDTPFYQGFHTAMRDNTHFHYEYFSNAMNNWIELDAYPSPEGLAVYFHSITDRKLMQERLDQAQHMESIGKLTGHVAVIKRF
ncbi:MAG: PAS domain-containing protein, partial [Pseudomonadota bacterium]